MSQTPTNNPKEEHRSLESLFDELTNLSQNLANDFNQIPHVDDELCIRYLNEKTRILEWGLGRLFAILITKEKEHECTKYNSVDLRTVTGDSIG